MHYLILSGVLALLVKDESGNKISDADRFAKAMSQIGPFRRLTYNELTGKDQSPRHETTGTGETAENVPF